MSATLRRKLVNSHRLLSKLYVYRVESVVGSSSVNPIQVAVAAAIHPGASFISGCGHAVYNLPATRGHERDFI